MNISNFFCKKLYLSSCLVCIIGFNSCAEKSIDNMALSGTWLISIFTSDVGKVQTIMQFDVTEEKSAGKYAFQAYTEKNTDSKILGFWKAHAGRLIGSNFKHGSLMRITSGVLTNNDSLSGVLVTPFGNYYVNGTIKNDTLNGLLSNGKHETIGKIEGSKGLPKLPIHNYNAILDSVISITHNKLYDPSLMHAEGWTNFINEMKRVADFSQDDAAFIMAFFYYDHKFLPFSHYALYHPLDEQDKKVIPVEKFVELDEKNQKTVCMKISSFSGTAAEMDSAFSVISAKGYDHLIIDLRNDPGGSVEAGMAFARHLVKDTLYGGVFLTGKYFAHHTELPAPKTYDHFLHFTEANYDLLISGISQYDGICLVVIPRQPVFRGKIDILINGQTASTCEPIIYALKRYHLARLVGERSAGAMLNGEFFPVMDGYKLFLPTATYYTADGYKIDKNGVEPDVKVKSDEALDVVLQKSNK